MLRGGLSAYYDGVVKTIADNSTISITNETIDGINYDTRRLGNEHDVAQIGTTKYTQLRNAIDAAGTGDIIELLEDNYLFYNLTISAEKDISIQTNNYDIITGNPIENNGKIKIINNNYSPSSPTFDYHESGYFITNNVNASLEIENVKINTTKGIDNNGTLSLNNTTITATGTAIYNKGNVTASNNITLSGDSYSIYSDGGESSYTNIDVDGKIYNKSGNLSLVDGTVDLSGSLIVWLISNQPSAELSLNNITETLDVDFYYTSDSGRYTYALYNAGTLYAKDSTISEILRKRTDAYAYAVYSTSSASFDNTSLVVDASNTTYDANQGYGVYTASGNIEFKSGSISVNRNKSYGIYTETGTITLGIPEQPGPTYGKENADVSTTNPDIRAVGSTTGIGVKNASGGKVYFYDGRITGSTSAMPENPTATEYMFDPKDYLDENNYHYRILEWRREQPSN